MPLVKNPILPGFNPDPSILRVGKDYYIATSTFEWYPGVQIHHSTDLANWTLLTRPLTRKSQLDMRGDPDSCGIWAPCLTHDGDKFWLVYTDVKRKDGSFKDAHNYIVWADKIDGEWSDPVYVNSSGFDPSLFHDPDSGKKYFVNMLWDHRRRPLLFAGIAVQEWDAKTKKLVGERKNVYQGTELQLAEAPHVYKRNGRYYMLIAEGGTGYEHACTFARAKDIWGPYETHPEKYMVTSKDHPRAALQRAGHGDIVETEDGRTYLVHLTGRPTTQLRRCVLGRETAIQECYWKDDWLYVKNGPVPSLWVDVLGERDEKKYWEEKRYTFEDGLHKDFQWLRTPETERIFNTKDGKLTLIGREAIGSWFEQALVARRQEHFSYDAETVVDFSPTDERQFAGLTAYYCRYNFFYLTVTAHSDGQRELLIMSSEASWPIGNLNTPYVPYVQIPNERKVKLALTIRGNQLQFYYAVLGSGDEELKKIGPVFDASIVSDECGGHQQHGSFTGAFVGVAASDLNGLAAEANFDYFVYKPVKNEQDAYVRDNE
ncbi:glycosyl hydrolases family 43-domain-containing protein [Sordaria sp. MPI-SDFR-AT-0083]|nr:glycosyl hydrolases family 43-domain-containing protein [Sordaria sp. MPI-SDFR-AT-0083]